MNITEFLLIFMGIVTEVALLFDRSRFNPPGIMHGPDIRVVIIVPALIVSTLIYGVHILLGVDPNTTYISEDIIVAIAVPIMLFILFYGIVSLDLLPAINEQNVATVHVIVLLSLVLYGIPGIDRLLSLIIFIAPTIVILYLGINVQTLSPVQKALVYFWYLILLMIVAAQNDLLAVFDEVELSASEAFIAGMIFMFIALHALFFLRFFLIVSSLLLPRNRPFVAPVMKHLFTDEQMRPANFVIIVLVTIALVTALIATGIVPEQSAINLAVLFGAQIAFKPQDKSGK